MLTVIALIVAALALVLAFVALCWVAGVAGTADDWERRYRRVIDKEADLKADAVKSRSELEKSVDDKLKRAVLVKEDPRDNKDAMGRFASYNNDPPFMSAASIRILCERIGKHARVVLRPGDEIVFEGRDGIWKLCSEPYTTYHRETVEGKIHEQCIENLRVVLTNGRAVMSLTIPWVENRLVDLAEVLREVQAPVARIEKLVA